MYTIMISSNTSDMVYHYSMQDIDKARISLEYLNIMTEDKWTMTIDKQS